MTDRISNISATSPRWSMSIIPRKPGRYVPAAVPLEGRSWTTHYHYGVYTVFALDLIAVIGYLTYVGIHMNNPMMYLRYHGTLTWLELNSYSLLSPFGAVPALIILTHHVKHRKKLVDGDFFGILAYLVLLSGISIHDATKILEKNRELANNHDNIRNNNNLRRAFADEVLRIEAGRKINYPKFKEIPDWIHELHVEHNCCGVTGYEDWVDIVQKKKLTEKSVYSCCCKSKEDCKKITCNVRLAKTKRPQGCAKAILKYLVGLYEGTFICMLTLASMHMLCVLAYAVHWVAMRKLIPDEKEGDAHPFSLIKTQRKQTLKSAPTPTLMSSTTSIQVRVLDHRGSDPDLDPNNEQKVPPNFFGRIFGNPPNTDVNQLIP